MKIINALLLLAALSARAQSDLHIMEGSVVRFQGKVPVTENIDGVDYEIWLKHPTNQAPFQKQATIFGSGFFVHGNLIYLVTAKHVALKMGGDATITFRGSNEQPAELLLKDFSPNSNGSFWIVHPSVDCAIHPIGINPV